MYELHKTWCADTLLSNSVMCAIGVLQHDKQKCWSPKCISSALLEPRPLSICAELIHFGLQHMLSEIVLSMSLLLLHLKLSVFLSMVPASSTIPVASGLGSVVGPTSV